MTAPANSIDPVAPAWRSEATASPTELDPMRIEPLQNRVLVRPDKTPDRIGSIIVPDNARAKQHRGTVLQVGDGKYLENGRIRPMFVKPGDRIIFNLYGGKYAGTTVKLNDGSEAILIEDDDVIARCT